MSPRSSSDNSMQRSQILKGAFAAGVSVICIGFVAWALWPKPDVVIPVENSPASQWVRAYGVISAEHGTKQDAMYWASSRITTEPTADKQGIVVRGKVNTAQELALLKDEFAKVQPAVPIDWQVTIGK